MRNFELWMVVAAERDVTAHFKPSNEIQQVKNYLQTETHDNRRTFLRTKRQTDKQTHIYKSVKPATDQLEVEIKKNPKNHEKSEIFFGYHKNRKIMKFQKNPKNYEISKKSKKFGKIVKIRKIGKIRKNRKNSEKSCAFGLKSSVWKIVPDWASQRF